MFTLIVIFYLSIAGIENVPVSNELATFKDQAICEKVAESLNPKATTVNGKPYDHRSTTYYCQEQLIIPSYKYPYTYKDVLLNSR